MRFFFWCWLIYLAITAAVFGRSLPYGFVYDDHMRVQFNPAITSLAHPDRFFWDRSTQAATADLHRDNYRPFVTLNYAADYSVWGARPGFYRLENLLFHSANATFVAALAQALLGLSGVGAAVAGLIFLLHPVQTEAVVWIASRSDVLSLFFFLLCLLAWERFRVTRSRRAITNVYLSFVFALFSRETAVVLPLALFLTDAFRRARSPASPFRWKHLATMAAIAAVFVGLRHAVLGQTEQSSFWGGGLVANLANVARTWPVYARVVLWPSRLRATYSDLDIVSSFADAGALVGALLLVVVVAAALIGWRRAPRVGFCLAFLLLLWLPASNLIPLTTLFAERLVYPLMIAVGFLGGLAVDEAMKRASPLSSAGARRLPELTAGLVLIIWAVAACRQTAVWRSDETLWAHATQAAPSSWFGWYALGLVQQNEAAVAVRRGDVSRARQRYDDAERSFISALKNRPPVDSGGQMFRDLARIAEAEGKGDAAREYARRAAALGFPSGS